jgi:hypothetical protein
VNAVPGAGFHYAAMIVSICVNEYRLRMGSVEHFVQIGKEYRVVEVIARRVFGSQRLVWFSDSYDFYRWIVKRVIEKSLNVSVNQSNDGDAERSPVLSRDNLSWSGRGREQSKEQHTIQEKKFAHGNFSVVFDKIIAITQNPRSSAPGHRSNSKQEG